MKRRPDHATDCPGCDTGWTASGLLCTQCENAVNTSNPDLYPAFMKYRDEHRAMLEDDDGSPSHLDLTNGKACMEAYYRGFIIGTARVLSAARAAQHAAWRKKK